jgi:hypothetical protein
MKQFVFPLDKLDINDKKWSWAFNLFTLSYNKLSINVKKVLESVYIEYNIKFYKKKIERIIDKNTFKQDKKSFNDYIDTLYQLEWKENTDKFLNDLKDKKSSTEK